MCLNTKIRNHHSRRAHGDRAGFLSQQTDGPHGKRSGQDSHGRKAEYLTRLLENVYLSDIVERRRGRQEQNSLLRIGDSFRKIIIIVRDNIRPWHDETGITTIGIWNFLLDEDSLDL